MPATPLELFLSYAPEDEPFRERLERHLSALSREGLVQSSHRGRIGAGHDRKAAVEAWLGRADIVPLLVNADFSHFEPCADVEVPAALARHREQQAEVIPVVLRACDWHHAPFGGLESLPPGGRPGQSWDDEDEALAQVAQRVHELVARRTAAGGAATSAAFGWSMTGPRT
jgi:TIR domain